MWVCLCRCRSVLNGLSCMLGCVPSHPWACNCDAEASVGGLPFQRGPHGGWDESTPQAATHSRGPHTLTTSGAANSACIAAYAKDKHHAGKSKRSHGLSCCCGLLLSTDPHSRAPVTTVWCGGGQAPASNQSHATAAALAAASAVQNSVTKQDTVLRPKARQDVQDVHDQQAPLV